MLGVESEGLDAVVYGIEQLLDVLVATLKGMEWRGGEEKARCLLPCNETVATY